ncbi:MAG: hypothetical protein ACREA0_15775 [bacterium]
MSQTGENVNMARSSLTVPALATILSLPGCDRHAAGPATDVVSLGALGFDTQRAHGLELTLRIDPATPASGGSFTATFAITNRRGEAATLTSGCTSIARGVVHRAEDDQWMPFIGTTPGCYTALSAYRIEAGETVKWVWDVQATTREYLGDFQFETTPAPPGDYAFRVSSDVIWIDGHDARLPELEAAFHVR